MSSSILGLVPARGGSKRLPGKNLLPLAGRTPVQRIADAWAASTFASAPLLLSTDDEGIRAEGARVGMLSSWLRPSHLATDVASSVDVALHALDQYGRETGLTPDWLVLLQPTSPFRAGHHLDRAQALMNCRSVDAIVATVELDRAASSLFWRGNIALEPINADPVRRVETPSGLFYFIRPEVLSRSRTFFPSSTIGVAFDRWVSLDIDTADDWSVATSLLALCDPRFT